jgi:hypothetical protein
MLPDLPRPAAGKPPRALSLAVSAVLATSWALLRLVVFGKFLFPLTYVLPLLVCVWSRDRVALWVMAALFAVLHTAGHLWILDPQVSSGFSGWASYGATMANILVAAVVVHAIIALRERLEGSLAHMTALADELAAQSEELAAQNEELTSQADELRQQNEEVLTQRHEIEQLNAELERRATLLEVLLDVSRLSPGEEDALQRICGCSSSKATAATWSCGRARGWTSPAGPFRRSAPCTRSSPWRSTRDGPPPSTTSRCGRTSRCSAATPRRRCAPCSARR